MPPANSHHFDRISCAHSICSNVFRRWRTKRDQSFVQTSDRTEYGERSLSIDAMRSRHRSHHKMRASANLMTTCFVRFVCVAKQHIAHNASISLVGGEKRKTNCVYRVRVVSNVHYILSFTVIRIVFCIYLWLRLTFAVPRHRVSIHNSVDRAEQSNKRTRATRCHWGASN